MRSRRDAQICCSVALLAAVVAFIVGADIDTFSYRTYNTVVGYSAVTVCVFAALAAVRSSWARAPLAVAVGLAALLADARLGPPCDCIDLTGFVLPLPIILLVGLAGVITTTDRQRGPSDAGELS